MMNDIELVAIREPVLKQEYHKPTLTKVGSLAELTQGFAGSVPDETGGQTKRNPFQG